MSILAVSCLCRGNSTLSSQVSRHLAASPISMENTLSMDIPWIFHSLDLCESLLPLQSGHVVPSLKIPLPRQAGHFPDLEWKENSRGSESGTLILHLAQKFFRLMFVSLPFPWRNNTSPPPCRRASSSRDFSSSGSLEPALKGPHTQSISCSLYLESLIFSPGRYILPSALTIDAPMAKPLCRSGRCQPFLALILGERIMVSSFRKSSE